MAKFTNDLSFAKVYFTTFDNREKVEVCIFLY